MRGLLVLVPLLLAGSGLAHADAPELEPFRLRNVQWQDLPFGVKDARVGPDGRLWLHEDREATTADVETQFSRPIPRVGAPIMMFGPGSWVWFVIGGQVRGFDGKNWAVVPEPCRGSVVAAGRAFFAGSAGVQVHDGRTWRLDGGPPGATGGRTLLSAEPDGKGVLAYRVGTNRMSRWRDGRWSRSPVLAPLKLATVTAIVARPRGAWFVTPARLEFVPFAIERPVPDWDRLIAGLRRDGIGGARRILAVGPAALGRVEMALATEPSLDTRRYLRGVRRQLEEQLASVPVRRFGGYRVHAPVLQWIDGQRLVLWSSRIAGPDFSGSGLLLFDGSWRVPRGRGFARRWRTGGIAPVRIDSERFVLPARTRGGRIAIVDSRTGAVQSRLHDPAYPIPVAAHPDGWVVVRPSSAWRISAPLAVWRPGAPDDREFLDVRSFEVDSWCVTGDRSLFVRRHRGPLERLDGEHLQRVPEWRGRPRAATDQYAGRGDAVALTCDGNLYLRARGFFDAGPWRDVVERNAARIRDWFLDVPIYAGLGLTATEDGSISFFYSDLRHRWDGRQWKAFPMTLAERTCCYAEATDESGARWRMTFSGRLERTRRNGARELFFVRAPSPIDPIAVFLLSDGRLAFGSRNRVNVVRIPG